MKKWADIKAETMSLERIERARVDARHELLEMTLRELREEAGKTQIEMAELTRLTQSSLSKLERRENNPLDALRRYVEALGGELEVVAALGNKRIKLVGI